MVILSALFCTASSFLARRERPGSYLLFASTGCAVAVALCGMALLIVSVLILPAPASDLTSDR